MPVPNMPIGTVAPFAGDITNVNTLIPLQNSGWLVCDGGSYRQDAYPELFHAIGTAHGGDAVSFNVPDLRGRFLRGTTGSAAVDPDAGNRTSAAPGGATGNNTGSWQPAATGLPKNQWVLQSAGSHTHTCSHLNAQMRMAWSGSTQTMARWNAPATTQSTGAHFHQLTGFDQETTPVCVAMYFIIKAKEPYQSTGDTPAGAIIAFGGGMSALPDKWLKCDGTPYDKAQQPNLTKAIGNNYGGDGAGVLNVPDLRGYFLRGASHDTGRDADAPKRHALNKGGNEGHKVGSAQFYATASPRTLRLTNTGNHYHYIDKVPQTSSYAAFGASGPAAFNCMVWTENQTTSSESGDHTHTLTGGDKETRPENIYTDFLIASDNVPQSAPPVGTILAFGGDVTDDQVLRALKRADWIPCDGGIINMAVREYWELGEIIGRIYGESFLGDRLPDLRGCFIIGAGKVRAGTLLENSKTGAPNNPIITTTDGEHTHIMNNVPTEMQNIDRVAGIELAQHNSHGHTSSNGEHSHQISGGDSESRPVNVSVNYIIRCK
ncbi:MAG: tail fiber protein [Dyadobacter sp.]|uniref:phage tail protein n=1 Tax=Dyadobacter sp. TaxID=1914288 RepID=UPI001B152D0F|nr:phage tail protein [Dyadobacter sp.]MBO9617012.1 tail fiber protein [Dyadobacter sp.]